MVNDGCGGLYCCCPPSAGASLNDQGGKYTFVTWSCLVRLVGVVCAAGDTSWVIRILESLLDDSVA